LASTDAAISGNLNPNGAGRIGMMKSKGGTAKYFYEINDHIDNVRAVIGSPYTDNFQATIEPRKHVLGWKLESMYMDTNELKKILKW